jgi:acyl-CoA thioesterase
VGGSLVARRRGRVNLAEYTALEPAGDGRWRGTVSKDWWIERGPFGGYLSALMVRAMIDAVGDPGRPPRSFTVHFVDAPGEGPLDVLASVERAGGSSTTLTLRLEQEGRPLALALGACAAWRDGEPEWADVAMPEVAPPEQCPELPHVNGAPGFHRRLGIRWAGGGAIGAPAERARNLAWLRLEPPVAMDHLAVTALSDGWMPAAFSKLGHFAVVPTTDLTIHFRSPLPVDAEWLLGDYRSHFSAGGAWEEDGELWTPDGRLVAQSRQLAIIRDRR